VKRSLNTAPVLGCPDDLGLGAVLSQDIEGQEKVIAYVTHRLTALEGNYTTTEKECLAIIWATRKMRCYLEDYRFEVVTDHVALKWLNSIESPWSPLWSDSTMGAGVTTVPVRPALPTGQIERGGGGVIPTTL